ncbi:putative ribonuclease H-like domain-containing protein [Tanacetum coccineum]
MDVKSAFLYGKIEEEVYVYQPLGFKDLEFPDRVYKVEKALYGLHQALRAWYETLSTYLLDNRFQRDDIIFGSTKKSLCTKFEKLMHKKFQMRFMDKYVDEILKKFGFSTVKTTSTPMETSKPLMKDENAEDVDVPLYRLMIGSLMYLTSSRPDIMFADPPCDFEAYTNSDYAGASLDRKSTTGVKNPVFHSKTKHIEIRHHFIRDSYEKRLIQVIKIHTDHNVADLLIKEFDIDDWKGLEMLRMKLGLKLCCQAKVNAARLLTTARLSLELQLLRVFFDYKMKTSRIEALKFIDSHNMVAYLEKSTENADFDEIVDFLNASPIRYALTVSPTIYVSYIEQFWSTAKIKIVNNERQIRAKVNGKTIVISESSVRRDLQFNDEDVHETVHEERDDKIERVSTTASSLEEEQDSGNILRTQSMATLNEPIPQGTGSGCGPRRQDTILGDRPA